MASLPELPAAYKTFLESHEGGQPYLFEDVDWWLVTPDKLLANVNLDGKKWPYIHQLRGHADSIAEFFENDETTDAEGNSFSFERLRAGLAFGTGNGDVVFLDPSDGFSVWCFYHDGGYVGKLAASFDKWISKAKLDEDY